MPMVTTLRSSRLMIYEQVHVGPFDVIAILRQLV